MGELGLMESLLPTPAMPMNINIPGLPEIEGTAQAATVVLCLMNMVTKEEYEGVCVHEYMCVCAGVHEVLKERVTREYT